MAHPNEGILRKIDQAMLAEDIPTFFSYYADDVQVHAGGRNKLAGEYRGKEELQRLFGRFMEAMGDYSFENHAYLADDQHGIILQTSKSERDGQTLTLQEVFVMHFGIERSLKSGTSLPTKPPTTPGWVEWI